MSVAIDEDTAHAVPEGVLGFQNGTGPPFKDRGPERDVSAELSSLQLSAISYQQLGLLPHC